MKNHKINIFYAVFIEIRCEALFFKIALGCSSGHFDDFTQSRRNGIGGSKNVFEDLRKVCRAAAVHSRGAHGASSEGGEERSHA